MKLLVLSFCVIYCNTAHLPSTFKKCKKSVPNFNQCLSEAVEDALRQLNKPIKEVGIPSLEPLEIPSLEIGAGTSAVQFDQHFKNMKVSGATKVSKVKADMDFEKNVLTLDIDLPEARMEFEYEVNGKILILPISGKGPGFIILENTNWLQSFELEKYDKKGKTHFKVSKTILHIETKHVRFQLDNLFNGDKTLGDSLNQVINDNWKEVFGDVLASYEKAFGQIYAHIFNQLLEKIPASELFED